MISGCRNLCHYSAVCYDFIGTHPAITCWQCAPAIRLHLMRCERPSVGSEPVYGSQVVLSHTPYRQLTHLKDKPVLLAGLGRLKEVAHSHRSQQEA